MATSGIENAAAAHGAGGHSLRRRARSGSSSCNCLSIDRRRRRSSWLSSIPGLLSTKCRAGEGRVHGRLLGHEDGGTPGVLHAAQRHRAFSGGQAAAALVAQHQQGRQAVLARSGYCLRSCGRSTPPGWDGQFRTVCARAPLRLRELFDKRCAERVQVGGAATRDDAAVNDDRLVDNGRTRVAQIGPHARI